MLRLSAGLTQKGWDHKLRSDSLTRDVYVNFTGTYADQVKIMPETIIFNVQKTVSPGMNSVTVALLKALSGDGTYGLNSLVGEEEDQSLKQIELFSNEVKHAVPTEQYGIEFFKKQGYNILQQVQPQLSQWHDEKRGQFIREALCENIPENLTYAPTSKTKTINSNVHFVGLADSAQPVYDSTIADYRANLLTAANAQDALTLSDAQLSVAALNNIVRIATAEKEIEAISMKNGQSMYVLTVDSMEAQRLRNPGDTSQLANIYKDADARGLTNQSISGLLGTYGPLMLIEDSRSPRVTIDAGPTVTFGYKKPGSGDSRPSRGANVYNVNILHGRGAVGMWEMEKLHFESEVQDYQRVRGVGALANYGVQGMEFDDETPTDSSIHNKVSMLVLTRNA